MKEFNYQVSDLEIDFFGESKIDVFFDDELVLEIEKIDNSLWLIQTSWNEENLILIKKELANKLVKFLKEKIKEKFNTELPVIFHPNFFMQIDTLNSN